MSIGFTRPGLRTGIYNHDKAFASLTSPPVIANDFDVDDPEDYQRFKNALLTHFDGEAIDNNASCACGEIRGSYNLGFICPSCGEQVVSERATDIESSLWIRAPKGVPGLILPELWILLSSILNRSHCNYFMWLIDKSYKPAQVSQQAQALAIAEKMEKQYGNKRGLVYFIEHFDEIIEFIVENTSIIPNKEVAKFMRFCDQYRDCFFPQHLAVPSNLIFVVEDLDNGRYVEMDLNPGIDAVMIASHITKYEESGQMGNIVIRTIKMLDNLTIFLEKFFKTIGKKEGDYRKHVYGSRLNFTARAVITSIHDRCEADELRIPYGIAVQLFKYHIIALARRRYKWPVNRCVEFIQTNTAKPNDLMIEILTEVFAKANSSRGPAGLFIRNPSLRRGSTQRFFLRFKTDPNDKTISIPPTVLKEENADFDGDEMSLYLLLDQFLTDLAEPLAPAHWVRSISEPRELNNSLVIPLQATEVMVSYVLSAED